MIARYSASRADMFHHDRFAEYAIVGGPPTLAVIAQRVDDALPGTGPYTLSGGILLLLGLAIRLYFNDRHESRLERQSYITAENARLTSENAELRKRADTLVTKDVQVTPNGGKHVSILMVEDSDALSARIAKLLHSKGHRVRRVDTVADAIREFDSEPPDCVLLDLRLVDGDGENVIEHIRKSRFTCRIVVVTGETDEGRLANIRKMHVKLLTKPVDSKELLELVRPDKTDEFQTLSSSSDEIPIDPTP